jgi:hypothetical protein
MPHHVRCIMKQIEDFSRFIMLHLSTLEHIIDTLLH